MSIEFEFADPPPVTRGGSRWGEAIAIAQRHPGKWLKFPAKKGSNPTSIRRDRDDIEVVKRSIGGEPFIFIRAEGGAR